MNVFYIGVSNPVDISVAGAAPSNVVATLAGSGRIDEGPARLKALHPGHRHRHGLRRVADAGDSERDLAGRDEEPLEVQ